MIRLLKPWFFTLSFLLLMNYGCNSSNLEMERKRIANTADKKSLDITVALVNTSTEPNLFIEGAKLAIEEINGDEDLRNKQATIIYDEKGKVKGNFTKNLSWNGGILAGRKIIPLIYEDEGKPKKGVQIAKKISQNLDVIAVIGHRFSSVAIPTSIIYEKNGIVFMSTGSTHPLLTAHGNWYIFRNIPTGAVISQAMAKFASIQGFQKIVIFFDRGIYGRRLAEFFKEAAEKRNIKVIATRSYFESESDFRSILAEIKIMEFDAIFVAGHVTQAAMLIQQARRMNIFVPFLGGDALDSQALWLNAELDATGTYVASIFDPDFSDRSRQFVERFEKRWDQLPDAKAAQGYDAIKVLAWAIENSRSTVPIEIATALKYLEKWEIVVGPYTFNFKGDIIGRQIHIKVLAANGKFKKITSISVDN